MPEFRVVELAERDLAQAYPLARSAAGVSSSRWSGYGQQVMAAGGGVLGVGSAGPCLYGLAAYRLQETLRYGPVLSVDLLAAIDVSSARPVRATLCSGLDAIARKRGLNNIILASRPGCSPADWIGGELVADWVGYRRQLADAAAAQPTG